MIEKTFFGNHALLGVQKEQTRAPYPHCVRCWGDWRERKQELEDKYRRWGVRYSAVGDNDRNATLYLVSVAYPNGDNPYVQNETSPSR